uniref:non-specific serine/threonine protein kinase n=1 Tax=Dunaliella tertiolecta TaxID=3047 RepID=A0A7S3QYD2_DUNTE|mmetsp:Transcript_7024/g.18887  ORF Transcript_7024/g.18887 Transcript_7024/m.18887 type:complete len:565 (+) Transcript_7024:146-1840(+)
MRLEDLEVKEKLAEGSFGVVYRCVRKADGRVLALKQVKLAGMKRVDRQEAIDEARMLAQLNHPHVCKHYDSFVDSSDRLNIIMEFASKGNVSQLIKAQKGKGLPEPLVWKFLIQSLLGLQHIHSKKIIHRDMKALNLFLDSNQNIKIGDLGIARALSDGSQFARSLVGTPYYLSPELCEDKPYNEKSDVWATGVVMYECCTGHYPFDAQNEGALIRKILRGQYPPITGPYSSALVQIINLMLTHKYTMRPDTASLLRNPIIVGKAKSLGIDMNPHPSESTEDQPVYEAPAQAGHGPPPLQPVNHPFSGAYPAQQPPYSAMPPYAQPPAVAAYGGPGYAQGMAGPPGSAGRPGSARLSYNPPLPGQHPFDLSPAQAAYPPQGYPAQQPPLPQQQRPQQQGPSAGTYDRMADEIERMQLGEQEFARRRAQQQQGPYGQPRAKADHIWDVQNAAPSAATPPNNRMRPEQLPPAGGRAYKDPRGPAPFALHVENPGPLTQAQMQSSQVWNVQYRAPQFGRKRCPDLQITGPSLRDGGRPGSARMGGYTPAADDATTYVSSSYATGYYK